MDGKSLDIIQKQLEKLKELFPEATSEGKVRMIYIDRPYNTSNDQLKTNTVLQIRDAGVEVKTI